MQNSHSTERRRDAEELTKYKMETELKMAKLQELQRRLHKTDPLTLELEQINEDLETVRAILEENARGAEDNLRLLKDHVYSFCRYFKEDTGYLYGERSNIEDWTFQRELGRVFHEGGTRLIRIPCHGQFKAAFKDEVLGSIPLYGFKDRRVSPKGFHNEIFYSTHSLGQEIPEQDNEDIFVSIGIVGYILPVEAVKTGSGPGRFCCSYL